MPRDGAGRRGHPDAARGVQPAEPCVERAAVAALEALEVARMAGASRSTTEGAPAIARRAASSPSKYVSTTLPATTARARSLRSAVRCADLVLAPGERPGHRHEQQHGEQQPDRKLAAVGDPATRERVFDLRGGPGSCDLPWGRFTRGPGRRLARCAGGERRASVAEG